MDRGQQSVQSLALAIIYNSSPTFLAFLSLFCCNYTLYYCSITEHRAYISCHIETKAEFLM